MELSLGAILEGKVTGITNFGAFVELPENKTGMVHISEVADAYVKEIRDFLKEGQTVKVKVISISEEGKISLSIKKAVQKPKIQESKKSTSPGRPGGFEWRSNRSEPASFEEMMQRFKQSSDEKISGMKKNSDSRRSGGYARRNSVR